jgi:hypothetical protein
MEHVCSIKIIPSQVNCNAIYTSIHIMTNTLDCTIVKDLGGDKYYCKNGKLHRDGDLPAIEKLDGGKLYFKNGELHRDGDLPAVEHSDGYYVTSDRPARLNRNIKSEYYQKGELHRDGDLPAVEHTSGYKEHRRNGRLHRDGDRPAVYHVDGYRAYYIDGQRHRDWGKPSIEYSNGNKKYHIYGNIVEEDVANFIARRSRAIAKYAFRRWYDWTYSNPNSNAFKARLERDMSEYEKVTGGFIDDV